MESENTVTVNFYLPYITDLKNITNTELRTSQPTNKAIQGNFLSKHVHTLVTFHVPEKLKKLYSELWISNDNGKTFIKADTDNYKMEQMRRQFISKTIKRKK